MVEGKLPFVECAFINKAPLFCGVNYPFWKIRMKIFIESLGRGVWDAIVNDPYVPKTVINGQIVDKPWSEWSDSESKKAQL